MFESSLQRRHMTTAQIAKGTNARRLFWSAASLCFSAILIGTQVVPASAQTDTATIYGEVYDRAGNLVGGVLVELFDIDRGVRNAVQTDVRGFYIFHGVRPGHYRMQASAVGFRSVGVTDI